MLYDLLTGHSDRAPRELVFLVDLTVELRAWPQQTWTAVGISPEGALLAVVDRWRAGHVKGLELGGVSAEEARALARPAMTYVREEFRARLTREISRRYLRGCIRPAAAGHEPQYRVQECGRAVVTMRLLRSAGSDQATTAAPARRRRPPKCWRPRRCWSGRQCRLPIPRPPAVPVGMLCGIVPTHAGGSMRVPSSRAATAAALLAGLAGLVVAGRLLPTAPSTRHPTTTTTTTSATATSGGATAQLTAREIRVPDAIGQTLAQATTTMRVAGLQGSAYDRDPQAPSAVVVAQEPPAGELVLPDSVIGFRTSTGVQPNATPRRVRLGPGPATATYQVVAPDPARHQLTVAVAMPRAADIALWLETGPSQRLPVLPSMRAATTCQPTRGQLRCVVRFRALDTEGPGVWTASVAKQSPAPAEIAVTVTFAPL